jgi:serine/threonine-protein kinase RsbW
MRFRLDPRKRTDEAGRLAWAEEVVEAVTGEARAQGLPEDDGYYLGAALREALLNALFHGRNRRGEPWVSVDLDCRPGHKLVVTVRDRGPGFQPESVPDPRDPGRCEGSCGRGLFFMRSFTDRLTFAFPGLGGSRVKLEKRLPAPQAASRSAAGRRGQGRRKPTSA